MEKKVTEQDAPSGVDGSPSGNAVTDTLKIDAGSEIGSADNPIDGDFMRLAKIGEGLCLASLVLGILAAFFTPFMVLMMGGYDFDDAAMGILLVAFPMSASAILTGVLGTRFQCLVSHKFGFGVAGAVLGTAILTIVVLIAAIYLGTVM